MPSALAWALASTARGGTLLQVGNLPPTAAPSVPADLVTREISWVGSFRFDDELPATLLCSPAD